MTKRKKSPLVWIVPVSISALSFLGLFISLVQNGNIYIPYISPPPTNHAQKHQVNMVSVQNAPKQSPGKNGEAKIENSPIAYNLIDKPVISVSAVEEITQSARPSTVTSSIRWPRLLESVPSEGYPVYNTLLNIVETWNPDVADAPEIFTETLQHFNYSDLRERNIAEQFRNAEIPFKLYDIPEIDKVVDLWSDTYLSEQLTGKHAHVEKSVNNHFMYWTAKRSQGKLKNWKAPTEIVSDMQFDEWLGLAKEADRSKLSNASAHYYFMSSSNPGDRGRTFVAKDMNMFSTAQENFFISNVRANKGIQCRFGMRGVIAESHFDGGRNMVAMLKGAKRYIVSPPTACNKLGIISDVDHPSYRHSVIDWSDMSQARSRGFDTVPAIDTILRQGEILYIPSYWFHYIISLQYSIQCNSRSGSPPNGEGQNYIEECLGKPMDKLKEYNRESGLNHNHGRHKKGS